MRGSLIAAPRWLQCEQFLGHRIGRKTAAAQRCLRLVAENRLPLRRLLPAGQVQGESRRLQPEPSGVDQVGEKGRLLVKQSQCLSGEVKGATVVGVAVAGRWQDYKARRAVAERADESLLCHPVALPPEAKQPGIRQSEEFCVRLRHSENSEGPPGLGPSLRAPATTAFRIDPPASFHPALRPGIVVPIGRKDDLNVGSGRDGLLDETACCQGFIVGMGGKEGHERAPPEVVVHAGHVGFDGWVSVAAKVIRNEIRNRDSSARFIEVWGNSCILTVCRAVSTER